MAAGAAAGRGEILSLDQVETARGELEPPVFGHERLQLSQIYAATVSGFKRRKPARLRKRAPPRPQKAVAPRATDHGSMYYLPDFCVKQTAASGSQSPCMMFNLWASRVG